MAGSWGRGRLTACATACLLVALALTTSNARTASAQTTPAMAALGDSLTRGWGTTGAPSDNESASWSTGTNAAVNSHFQRLAPLRPGLTASNAAQSGSKMGATSTQADSAVAAGAIYITLLSGTNDVCTTSVASMTSISSFTTQLRTTLTELAAIPGTTILVASIPDWYSLWSDFNTDPDALLAWSTRNVCPTIFGNVSDADRQAARQRITDFNIALATECATFAPCTYDGGAVHALRFTAADLAFDFFHPSLAGQARLAEATWDGDLFPPPPSPPSNTALPTISGTAQEGQTLTASTGTWSGSPTSFAYQWRRCNTSGSGCADIGSATSSSYLLVAADVGSTLRVRVTATNGAGSSSAESAQTAVVSAAPSGVPPGFTSVFTDPGCGGCSVSAITDGLRATIAGAANTLDTAYAVQDFGGVAGRVWVRDVLALAQGQTLSSNLAVLQLRDSAGTLVYELYLGSDRVLRLYSPAGGLRSTSIVASTGVVVPNNGSSSLVVEVSALKSSSIIVRVDGVDRITLGGLSGGTTGNQRYLRVGSDHYDGSSSQPVTSDHTHVGSSQTTWLGAPGGGPPPPSPPSNTALPTISGTAQEGQTLTASTGTWSGSPTSFAYQWRRCNTSGSGCADIGSATSSSYLLVAADVGSTLRVRVTATNGAGSSSAESAQTAVVSAAPSGVPPGFTSVFTDPGCGGCSVSAITDGLRATIAGAANTLDTAYAVQDFGGVAGRVWVRDVLALAQGQTLSSNLAVLQLRDSAGTLVYELYLGSDRVLRLYSPAGGLRSTSIVASTGVVVPNNGSSSLVVEVSALKSSSIIVRVDGVDRITLGGLSGGTTGNQRYLRVGSDHYDGSSSQPVTSDHTHVGSSQTTWLGAPGGGPPPPSPPSNTALPTISGTAQEGQTLTASTGTWSGSPTSFAYQWRRCNTSGSGCADIGSATSSSYLLVAADVGSTLRVRVTATNGAGSSSAESAQTAVVSAAPSGVPPGFTSVFTDPGCGGCSVSAITDGLRATIAGAANTLDTAYAVQDFGGVAGRVWVRDVLALAQGQTLSSNLAVLQLRDSAGTLVYELYLGSDRVLRLYSPAGGLRSTSIVASTGVVVPNNGSSSLVVEVSALKSSSIIVRVDGVDRITLGGLSGGTTGNQRYLRVGSDHYDGSSSQPVTSDHTHVGSSQTTWLGAP